MRYGSVWRQHRALLHRKFHPTASEAYEPAQDKHTCKLLCALLSDSTDPIVHIKQAIGALIMEVSLLSSTLLYGAQFDGIDHIRNRSPERERPVDRAGGASDPDHGACKRSWRVLGG
jgi:cytochrome P450